MKRLLLVLLALSAAAVAADYANDHVVVSRGTAKLTFADIDVVVDRLPAAERGKIMDNPTRIENTLSSMLLVRQLADQARAQGLDKDPEVQAEIAWTVEEKLAAARTERFARDIKVPELEALAKERYLANKANYTVPEVRNVRHLLVEVTAQRDDAQAKALADELYKTIKADPSKFNALVMERSDDQSKKFNQGVIANATSDQLDPDFVAAAKALQKPGDISAPVKSGFGYHIIRLESVVPTHVRSFEEVRGEIVNDLRKNFVDQKKKDFIDQLRNMNIDADPDAVASLRDRYANDAAEAKAATEDGPVKKH